MESIAFRSTVVAVTRWVLFTDGNLKEITNQKETDSEIASENTKTNVQVVQVWA